VRIAAIQQCFQGQCDIVEARLLRKAAPTRMIPAVSTPNATSGVKRRTNVMGTVSSVARLPSSAGCLSDDQPMTSSSATAGSSNVSVPGKYRLR
jgi:hypothetical protein